MMKGTSVVIICVILLAAADSAELRPKVITAEKVDELLEAMRQVWPSGMEAFLVDIADAYKVTICTGFFFMEKGFLSSDECMRRRENDDARLYPNYCSENYDFEINDTKRIRIPCEEVVHDTKFSTFDHPVKVFVEPENRAPELTNPENLIYTGPLNRDIPVLTLGWTNEGTIAQKIGYIHGREYHFLIVIHLREYDTLYTSRPGDPLFIQGKLLGTLVKQSIDIPNAYYYCTLHGADNLFNLE